MPNWLIEFIEAFWNLTVEMSPWLLLGFFIAGLIKFLLDDRWVQKFLGRGGWKGAIAASLWGIPLPLCSCGVIPVAHAIRRQGASREATLAFLTSTPQTGADSFMATLGLLGLPIAIIRVIVAFLTGILSGKIAGALANHHEPARGETPACCNSQESTTSTTSTGFVDSMYYGFWTLPKDINIPLLMGLAIGALLSLLGGQEFFNAWLKAPATGYLTAVLFALPLYVCSTGSIPMATGLVASGASPGAAMLFLILGPATNTVTIASIHSMVGRRATLAYLGITSAAALLTALTIDLTGLPVAALTENFHNHEETAWWKISSGIILLALMIAPILPYRLLKKKSASKSGSAGGCCSSGTPGSPDATGDDCCSKNPNSGQCH